MSEELSFDILHTVLDSAYEGIVIVDKQARIIHFNNAYSRITGIKKEQALGQPVTDIIDNTQLHMTLQTGQAERGKIQVISGQEMVVHRIPIWRGEEVVAAVGMLIFEGVSELHKILEMHQEKERKADKALADSQKKNKKQMVTLDQIIGKSKEMSETKRIARRAAKTLATVLITGESGTGKEMFAQSIHQLSPFADGPFVSVNCAAIPEHLLEAELFGYEEGAFTGARKGGKPGKFELADQGTLFLDEIGDMPMIMQSKILRVLQEKEGMRVGGLKPYRTNVRIVAATNKELEQMVSEGGFREDLYYRLNIIRLHIPPLRERKEDIPLLLSYYVKEICERYLASPKHFTEEAVKLLTAYNWPGNIREVVNIVERIVSLAEGEEISATDLPSMVLRHQDSHAPVSFSGGETTEVLDTVRKESMEQEREVIINVLKETKGNKSQAAKKLGIHRSTLYEKLKKLQIK
ncbi:sigma-54 interaction domain-containing protein [Thalassorhabdus alkalitolerans]|uniref:Sigma-54 interaction domain-containing protein n=1 Tax=Thalassorhabdus alkalitolerans TaxID=2282697 RepID=A0ABW0YQ26_9BACI